MLKALYYPYTTVQSLDALKAMALYFDEIHVISPFESYTGDQHPSVQDVCELESEGMIKFVSPSKLLLDYDDLMTSSVISDLSDPDFRLLSNQENHDPWTIYAEKVPSGLPDALMRKYLVEIPGFYNAQSTANKFRKGPPTMPSRRQVYGEMREIEENRDRHYREYRQVTVPFQVGEAIMINHALCASSSLGLAPITDQPIHNDFLMLKFQKGKNSQVLKRILADYDFIKDARNDLTATKIISETIPTLSNISISDLLEFRDENKDELRTFRTGMGKIATEVESNFWEPDFNKKIRDTVDGTIKPAIEELRTSTESTKERLARIFKKGAIISPLPIVATVAPGVPSAVALALAAGVLALDEYLDSLKRKKMKLKNGFAYLFDMQNRLSEDVSKTGTANP